MPIFCDTRFTTGGGRVAHVSPWQTVDGDGRVVAMGHGPDDVLGPDAASPPKNTFGGLDWSVTWSSIGMPRLVEFDAAVGFDPGKRVFLADGDQHVVAFEPRPALRWARAYAAAFASYCACTFWNQTPVSRPPSCSTALGTR